MKSIAQSGGSCYNCGTWFDNPVSLALQGVCGALAVPLLLRGCTGLQSRGFLGSSVDRASKENA